VKPVSRFLCQAFVAGGLMAALAAPAGAADDKSYNLATRLGAQIEKCWIASKDPAFASYIYSPEPNATGGPRILLVPRKTPTGAPSLVVQVVENGNHVSVFGALATSPAAGRIGSDLRRWISGGEGCS
jgi:hypothetical protein